MEYAYAALLLSESGEELNERNLQAVLEAANCAVSESRVKALVAALEDVEVDDIGPGEIGRVDATGPSEGGGEHRSDEAPEGVTGESASHDPATGEGGDESG